MAVAWWSDRPSVRAVSCSAVRRCRSPRRSEQVCESPMAAPLRRTPKLSFSWCAAWSKVCWSEASRVRGGSRRHRATPQLGLRPFGFRRAAQLQRGGLLGGTERPARWKFKRSPWRERPQRRERPPSGAVASAPFSALLGEISGSAKGRHVSDSLPPFGFGQGALRAAVKFYKNRQKPFS